MLWIIRKSPDTDMNDIGRNKTNYCTQLSDQTDEKTALLKALLNLKDVENDTIEVLLNMAENTGDLKKSDQRILHRI